MKLRVFSLCLLLLLLCGCGKDDFDVELTDFEIIEHTADNVYAYRLEADQLILEWSNNHHIIDVSNEKRKEICKQIIDFANKEGVRGPYASAKDTITLYTDGFLRGYGTKEGNIYYVVTSEKQLKELTDSLRALFEIE